MSTTDLDTFVKAFVHEPSTNNLRPHERLYLTGDAPEEFPSYIASFSTPDNQVTFNTTSTATCCGIDGCSHIFLRAEEHNICSRCEQTVCTTCDVIVQENDDGIVVVNKGQRDKMNNTKILCLHCYEVRSLCKYLPERTLRHCNNNDSSQTMDNGNFGSTTELSLLRSKLSSLKSRGEMTDALYARGTQDIATASLSELQGIYDAYIEKKKIDCIRNKIDSVAFPTHPSKILDEPDTLGAHLVDIDFSKGGKFMWDDSIQRNIFSVIRLLASFVSFREKDIHYNSFDSPVYNVAPSMLVDIAYNCRIDSGHR